ncbi:MAG: HYR domain-containing protein, partial [Flavobacteriales bacterium]
MGSVLTDGNQEVIFTVSDGLNESTVLSVELNLVDNLSWTIESCPSNSELFLDTECNVLLPDYTSDIDFVAGCSVDLSFVQSPLPGTIISGEQEVDVEITISGNNGEEESCSFTVEVQDDSPPEMTCEDVILPAISCSSFMPDVAEFNWADDPCTLVYYSQSISIGDELEIGTHSLSVQAFSGGETPATCEVQVTVVDNQAPIVDCSSANPIQIESGCEYTIEDFTGDIQVEDNCLSFITIAQHFIGEDESNIGQSISQGEYGIEFIVSDGTNTTTCSRNLQVVNTLIPSLSCNDNISVDLEEGDACSKTVEFEIPEIVNSCGTEQLVQSAGLPSGSEFPVGVTQNTFNLVENDNIIATCSFDITVVDAVIPTITCPEPITSCNPIVFFELPEASDNCGTVSIEQMSELDFSSGSSFPL